MEDTWSTSSERWAGSTPGTGPASRAPTADRPRRTPSTSSRAGSWSRRRGGSLGPGALRDEVLSSEALGGWIKGWRRVEGYTARADVGARFGDLERGVDPTDAVVKILTGNTELRFHLLEHPTFVPNHDIIHLYFNTLGLFYPEEVAALEARAEKVKGFMRRQVESRYPGSRAGSSGRSEPGSRR